MNQTLKKARELLPTIVVGIGAYALARWLVDRILFLWLYDGAIGASRWSDAIFRTTIPVVAGVIAARKFRKTGTPWVGSLGSVAWTMLFGFGVYALAYVASDLVWEILTRILHLWNHVGRHLFGGGRASWLHNIDYIHAFFVPGMPALFCAYVTKRRGIVWAVSWKCVETVWGFFVLLELLRAHSGSHEIIPWSQAAEAIASILGEAQWYVELIQTVACGLTGEIIARRRGERS